MAQRNTCPNCGASMDGRDNCPYCGDVGLDNADFSRHLEESKNKREIERLQARIEGEKSAIQILQNGNSPKGCLKIGLVIILIAFALTVFGVILMYGRDQGLNCLIPIVGFVVVSIVIYAISKYCDDNGNKDTAMKINGHRRMIKKYEHEIQKLTNGTR